MSRFLGAFRQYFAQATDAPFEYGEAAGLMAISTLALGRRWLDYGDGIRPNLFLMLVGDSSVARKSTCVGFAQKLVTEIDDQRVGPRDYTVEGLIRWMQEKDPSTNKSRNKLTLFAEEFGADLARMEAYGATTQADFCALYDGGTFEKARARAGVIRVDKPRVGLFAACAYHMMEKYLRPRDWFNGYLMRFVYVAPRHMREKFTLQPQPQTKPWKDAVLQLKLLRDDMQRRHFSLQLDSMAMADYQTAVQQFDQFTFNGAPIVDTYKARFGVSILKLALLYQLDENPMANVGQNAMRQALNFAFGTCWPSFQIAYQKTALNDFNGLFSAVLDTLRQQPQSRPQLAQRFLGNEQFSRVIEYLKQNGLVTAQQLNGTEVFAPRPGV